MTHDPPTTVAACPRCQSQLALPLAPSESQLECPVCSVRFALSAVAVRALPMARLASTPAPATAEPFAWSLPDAAVNGVHVWEPPASSPSTAPDLPADDELFDPGALTIPITHESTIKLADALRLDGGKSADGDTNERLESAAADVSALVGPRTELLAGADFATMIAKLEADDETNEFEPIDEAIDDEAPDDEADTEDRRHAAVQAAAYAVRFSRRRRKKTSTVRMAAGIVAFGVAGLVMGAYALLWLKGAPGDVFQLAQYLPSWMLPPSMQLAAQGDDPPVGEASRMADDNARADSADDAALLAEDADSLVAEPTVTPAAAFDNVDNAGDEGEDVVPAAAEEVVEPPAPAAVAWPATALLADVQDLRTFTLADFKTLVPGGEAAAERFVAGDLSKPELVRDMGQAYVDLCALAESLTLVEPGVYGSELFTAQLISKAALRSAAAPARRADLAVIASRWLEHGRRMNQGAVFVGEVRRLGMQGRWTENEIAIGAGQQHTVVHVLTEGVKFSTGDAAGIVGAIIDRPSERIAGYEGDAAQVVVAGYTFDPAMVVDEPAPAPEFSLLGE